MHAVEHQAEWFQTLGILWWSHACTRNAQHPAHGACAGAGNGSLAPALVYASIDRAWTLPAGGGPLPGRVRRSLGAKALLDGLWQRCALAPSTLGNRDQTL